MEYTLLLARQSTGNLRLGFFEKIKISVCNYERELSLSCNALDFHGAEELIFRACQKSRITRFQLSVSVPLIKFVSSTDILYKSNLVFIDRSKGRREFYLSTLELGRVFLL